MDEYMNEERKGGRKERKERKEGRNGWMDGCMKQ